MRMNFSAPQACKHAPIAQKDAPEHHTEVGEVKVLTMGEDSCKSG